MAETAEKRAVHTDALYTLGTIIGPDEKRDAIHLAVEPAVAGQILRAGQNVCRQNDGTWVLSGGKLLGIVDPFLTQAVKPGERFWLIVYPRQITALHHVWEHPDFPPPMTFDQSDRLQRVTDRLSGAAQSKEWIAKFASKIDEDYNRVLDYEDVMDYATDWLKYDKIACMGAELDYDYLNAENVKLFWEHYERITRKQVPAEKKESFFRCAC